MSICQGAGLRAAKRLGNERCYNCLVLMPSALLHLFYYQFVILFSLHDNQVNDNLIIK